MVFPVLIIKVNDPALYYFEKNKLGLVSKGGETFYKTGEIYDSAGGKFRILKINRIKKASFLRSLQFFQSMNEVNLDIEIVEKIELREFKETIVRHIKQYNKYWLNRDLVNNLSSSILKKESHRDIIKFLK